MPRGPGRHEPREEETVTDDEFPDYVEVHARTERAGFVLERGERAVAP